MSISGHLTGRVQKVITPEFVARMRRRRPGYDSIYDLVQQYDELPPDKRAQLSELDLSEYYIQPMFQALGWSVWERSQNDLKLEYEDLQVPVEIKRAGESLDFGASSLRQWLGGPNWGILTDFETVRIWDLRDPDHVNLLLETSSWSYVANDREEDDLLAAEMFYKRFAQPPSKKEPPSFQPVADMTKADQIAADVELGVLTPSQALAFARLVPELSERAEALLKLAPHLSEQLLEEALAAAREIEAEAPRARALEGVAPHLPEGLREQVLEEARAARAAAQEAPTEPERIERIEIATRALADTPSKVDLLGFSVYARALADFIKNEKTEKPLTIGIDAAWGMGKTTLMLMIRDQLTGQGEKKRKKRERSFPTVWFNAWKYDQEESLWAALALQILAEVRKQFNWWERLQLWLKLNYQRIDRALLWRSAFRLLISVTGIYLLGAVVFGILAIWLGTDVLIRYAASVGILGFIAAMYAAGKEIFDRLAGPFDLNLAEYVRKPNYKERIGFLAQFEEDFERVIDAVTENGRWSLVVFIDDLDRCAPPRPAEIIEAINILLDAEHCVFVIGMDAQAVAGSIEAKYSSLQNYLNDADDPGGLTLGQRFLEKIVQINFRIPRADPKLVQSFVDANLDVVLGGAPFERPPIIEEVSEAEQLIEAEQRVGKSLNEAAQAVQAARPDIPREVVTKAREEVFARSFDDSEDVRRAIHMAVQYLGLNPRKIKRFINVFRLQTLIANRRGLLERREIRLGLLAKWVIIVTRWPDLIAAMMGDPGFINRLMQAYRTREDLREIESRGANIVGDPPEPLKARLDVLTADPRIRRLIDAADLVQLLDNMTQGDIATLPRYLHLSRITTEGSRLVRA